MDTVTVAVCTYGDQEWIDLAERAVASAHGQAPTVHVHAGTLHDARNQALSQVNTTHIVYLDADDELEPGYIAAVAAGSADIRAPAVRYRREGAHHCNREPYVPKVAGHAHDCVAECLQDGNWIIVGAWAPVELLRRVGGWRDWPMYEDWCLWQRCWLAGATVEAVPAAVYRATVRPASRNRAPAMSVKNEVHAQIVAANMPVAA